MKGICLRHWPCICSRSFVQLRSLKTESHALFLLSIFYFLFFIFCRLGWEVVSYWVTHGMLFGKNETSKHIRLYDNEPAVWPLSAYVTLPNHMVWHKFFGGAILEVFLLELVWSSFDLAIAVWFCWWLMWCDLGDW